ncbi:Lactonase, 7-bladed beta-propeller-domain-containing protein [Ephemerocybe angulata]|uniref:Lactonase, 7-bladed beta-propeller-domain-containing protein n=1 Tax=Ephemerocybe angulata TaxID=980116 RepID=A0A8H6HI50_9AGAR|nr:Lactonase, 7-bladed beta-propeller-domain-containing protein [Tulosesus angulatus]
MPKYPILVASYTNDIVTLEFDSDKATLIPTSALAVGHHPSWIDGHPTDKSLIFTGLEQSDGKLVALRYDASGKGAVVAVVPSIGADPCSVLVDKDQVISANYSSGNISVTPISITSSESPFLSDSSYSIQFSGVGPDKSRQEASHPHQVILHPKYNELLVPDLGADIVRRYKKDANGRWQFQGHIGFESGGGPRHVAFYGDDLFTILELSSKIVRHHLPPAPTPPKLLASKPTMSNPLPTPNDMLAAEILIPPTNSSFPTPYLYASNRNDPSPEGDIIAIYAIEQPGSLDLITEVRTGLKHVRGVVIGGPDDRYVVVGGGRGGGVKVFERVEGGKDLKVVAEYSSVEAPTNFWWLPPV